MNTVKQKSKQGQSKSKTKVIAKAKILLANPIKPKVPSLEKIDLEKLQHLLVEAIKESGQKGKVYATATNINLGLESTLRSINNGKAGCVLLSANIKPKYVLGLIARNLEVKDSQVPVYVETDLEHITQNIFNIRALALTLPKHSKCLSEELQLWVEQHLRPKKPVVSALLPLLHRPKTTKQKASNANQTTLQLQNLKFENEADEAIKPQSKPWGSDYISFSTNNKPMDADEDTSSDDHGKLQDVLGKMINKINEPALHMEMKAVTLKPAVETVETSTSNELSDVDDFLGNYAPLTLQKVTPNANRKPRKKRAKNKKLAKEKNKSK